MERLKETWLTDGLIDFEYKKYLLLAFLKDARDSFRRVELYPFLSDLVLHYRNMIAIKEGKDTLTERFPHQLSLEHIKDLRLTYTKMIQDDDVMKEIDSIIDFSLPRIKTSLDEGSFIYEHVESQCEITPVGLTSLYAREGYLFIAQPPETETQVYRFQVTIFDQSTEVLRSIRTQYLMTSERNLSSTYEHLKLKLIREYRDLPNPSTYLVLSKVKFPLQHTLMPVAKRLLVKQISPDIEQQL